MRRAALIVVAALAVALLLGGCGGGGKRTIPTKRAESMLAQLDKIGSQFDNNACTGAGAKVRALESQARALPGSVDAEVRRNLVAGLQRLDALVSRQCQRPTPTNTTPTTPTVPSVPTTTAPPTNTTPTTTPTTPTTTPTTPNTTPTTPGGGGGVTVPGGTTGVGGAGSG